MKKLIPVILCLLMVLCACEPKQTTAFESQPVKLSVCPGGRESSTFHYTDPEKIAVFTTFIDTLYANAADLSAEDTTSDGEFYTFTFYYEGGGRDVFYFNGDAFYTIGELVQGMTEPQRQEFRDLLDKTQPDIPAQIPFRYPAE